MVLLDLLKEMGERSNVRLKINSDLNVKKAYFSSQQIFHK